MQDKLTQYIRQYQNSGKSVQSKEDPSLNNVTINGIDAFMIRKQRNMLMDQLKDVSPSDYGKGMLWGVVRLLDTILDSVEF